MPAAGSTGPARGGPFFRRLRGDLRSGSRPGLTPSPGRSCEGCSDLLVPVSALQGGRGARLRRYALPAKTITHQGSAVLPGSSARASRFARGAPSALPRQA
ncbi:hypothetical protein C1I98_35195 [Spongiactinospora gelatinilytica]|uniref:Uncharacterized protein n=1 Tax=Spongiactinospora gelatinilytica TaxID=2666298 RepID=A0A2W2EPX3_9ACTN|nr:hypothetical protein C1I98_35195 [Spongiactinospora gelatinilytica]